MLVQMDLQDQRIVIVGQRVTPEIRQTATFLCSKGLRVTCVEFTFFQANGGTRLLSQEIVVGTESEKPKQVSSGSLPVVTEDAFLASVDENGRAVFARILELAKSRAMPPDSVYKQTLRTTLRDRGGIEKKSAVPENEIQALWKQADATNGKRVGSCI